VVLPGGGIWGHIISIRRRGYYLFSILNHTQVAHNGLRVQC